MNQYTPPPPQFHGQPQPQPQAYTPQDEFDDWGSVEEQPERTLIPKGDYKASLEKINQETVKSGNNVGKPRYNCHFTITDEKQNGRKVFIDFMPHSEFSRSQVKALALATNTPLQGNMLQVLMAAMDKEFIANVGISKGTDEYSDRNTIWNFKALVSQEQPTPASQPPAEIFVGQDGVSQWVKDSNQPSGFRQVG